MTRESGNEGQQEPPLTIHLDEMTSRFSDLVIINSSPESVVLSFLQRLPRNEGPGDSQPEAAAVGRIALAWPHFFRLVTRMTELAKQRREEVVKHVEEQASQLETT